MNAKVKPPRTATVLALTGADAAAFLQGLVTNDVRPLEAGPGIVWAALLTPQGKYLADFFVVRTRRRPPADRRATRVWRPAPLRRLTMYRLRADVQIAPPTCTSRAALARRPPGALADPRHPALGWRAWRTARAATRRSTGTRIRVEHLIPESGRRADPRRQLHPGTRVRAAARRRFPQGLLCRAGGDRADEAQDRAAQGPGPGAASRARPRSGPRSLARTTGRLEPCSPKAGDSGIAYLRHDRANGILKAGWRRLWVA